MWKIFSFITALLLLIQVLTLGKPIIQLVDLTLMLISTIVFSKKSKKLDNN